MIWERIKDELRETIAKNIMQLWIDPLQFIRLEDGFLYLSSPDKYFSAYVKHHFSTDIESKLHDNGSPSTKVIFCDNPQENTVSKNKQAVAKQQLRLPNLPKNNSKPRSLHPRYTFDEFMVGKSNIFAESACRSMVAEDGLVGPCLYINSDTGLGKSHLTHAVAHQVFSKSPMTRLHYLTAKQFSAEMIRGIQTRTMDDFKRKYQEFCDILLVEDIHCLTGKKKTQEELNEILDTLIKSGKKVIFTSNSAPHDLVGIDNEFRSRMTSGLVTTIEAPDVTTRYQIVKKKAVQQRLPLDEALVDYLANHIRGDVRRIESALIAIHTRSRLTNGQVNLDLVKEVVSSVVGTNQVLNSTMICDLVGGQFNVSTKELQSRSRKKSTTIPRQIAMYLARKYTNDSLADIGKVFNRDHSTVLHAIKVVANKLVRDTSVNVQLEVLSKKITQL